MGVLPCGYVFLSHTMTDQVLLCLLPAALSLLCPSPEQMLRATSC
jgi:hypothetical protein